ncbi:MAG: hypothetical protein ACP5I8_08790, partial [Phycisphaerae bacterium]
MFGVTVYRGNQRDNPEFWQENTVAPCEIMTYINFRFPGTKNSALENQGNLQYLHENTLPSKNHTQYPS